VIRGCCFCGAAEALSEAGIDSTLLLNEYGAIDPDRVALAMRTQ